MNFSKGTYFVPPNFTQILFHRIFQLNEIIITNVVQYLKIWLIDRGFVIIGDIPTKILVKPLTFLGLWLKNAERCYGNLQIWLIKCGDWSRIRFFWSALYIFLDRLVFPKWAALASIWLLLWVFLGWNWPFWRNEIVGVGLHFEVSKLC